MWTSVQVQMNDKAAHSQTFNEKDGLPKPDWADTYLKIVHRFTPRHSPQPSAHPYILSSVPHFSLTPPQTTFTDDKTVCYDRNIAPLWGAFQVEPEYLPLDGETEPLDKGWKQRRTFAAFKTGCQKEREQQAIACCSRTIFSWGFAGTRMSFIGTSSKELSAYRLSTLGRLLPYCHL